MAFERIRRIGTAEAAQRLGGLSKRRACEIMAEIERDEPEAVVRTAGGHRKVSLIAIDAYLARQQEASRERNRRNRRDGAFARRAT